MTYLSPTFQISRNPTLAIFCTYFYPECLLQRPETSKLPKVVKRGCKRCLARWRKGLPRVSCTTATLFCNSATLFCTSPTDFWSTCTKTPSAPSPNHFCYLEVSGLCSKHFRSQFWGFYQARRLTCHGGALMRGRVSSRSHHLSGVLNRDLRQYSCDTPCSAIGTRRQLELRY